MPVYSNQLPPDTFLILICRGAPCWSGQQSRVEEKFATQPAVEAAIRQTIGTTNFDLGLYPEAKRQLERALELRNRTLGEAHTDTLKTMASLTEIYGMEGNGDDEAEALNLKTLQIPAA